MLSRITLAVKTPALRRMLAAALSGPNIWMRALSGPRLRWAAIEKSGGDLLIVEDLLVPPPSADRLRDFCANPAAPGVVLLAQKEDPEARARLLAAGCDAVLFAGLPRARLSETLDKLIARRRAADNRTMTARLGSETPTLDDFNSRNADMRYFLDTARKLVESDVSLLIMGETGVGKEWLARAIHNAGARREGPFVPVNCGALPDHLLESELFGHEEGAFTGAIRSRRGMFELAHGGTIFLDEIGEAAPHLQVKLLRVLQDHVIQPIGSEEFISVNVRVIAATNRDLASDLESELFRRDLYYRLSPVTLTIPPLRDRREDIPDLVRLQMSRLRARAHRSVSGISPEAMELLCRYDWPGNIRELINVLERAMLLCRGEVITPADLPETVRQPPGPAAAPSVPPAKPSSDSPLSAPAKTWREVRAKTLEEAERAYFSALLRECEGRIGSTARRAGMHPRTLFDRLRKLGIRKEDFRPSAGAERRDPARPKAILPLPCG